MSPSSLPRLAMSCMFAACASVAVGAPRYHVIDLGVAASPYPSAVTALNRAGLAVGTELVSDTLTCVAFDHGGVTNLGTMGGTSCEATGVEDDGTIVGGVQLADGTGNMHAFIYRGGAATDLGALPDYPNSFALGINRHGHVVGNVSNPLHNLAVVWRNGQIHSVQAPADGVEAFATAINAHDDVTGTVLMSNDHRHAFVWQDGQANDLGTLANLPNGESAGYSINDKGQVAGFSSGDGFPCHAALFAKGKIVDLGTIPASDPFATSVAMDIDNRGWIVGTSDDGGGASYAFLWNGKKLFDLDLLLDPASAVSWRLVSARAINPLGQIAGMAFSGADGLMHAYLAVPNP